MRPPICEVCDEPFDPSDGGGLVRFVATAAGEEFRRRSERTGVVGHPPDDGWFCAIHVSEARRLSPGRTLSDALRVMRRVSDSAAPVEHRAVARDGRGSRIDHTLGRTAPVESVRNAFTATAEEVLSRFGMENAEPVEERRRHRAPSPEWRDAATTTGLTIERVWQADGHRIRMTDEDIRWDEPGPLGERAGGVLKGTLVLAIDRTRLVAAWWAEPVVTLISESGERAAEIGDSIDRMLERLRSGS